LCGLSFYFNLSRDNQDFPVMQIKSGKADRMKVFGYIATVLVVILFACSAPDRKKDSRPDNLVLVIHGGAGVITRQDMSAEQEKAHRQKLEEALRTGLALLRDGHSSLDAVQAAIIIMEDSPLFNAGKGAVFAANGKNEMDASIMDGKTGQAGAVAGVRHIKNPIALARLVMEKTPHVLLSGEGAEEFARSQGITMMPDEYFYTDYRWQQFLQAKEKEKAAADSLAGKEFGTVGALALDKNGILAAGTSTGGMTYKKYGRIGDSPIIGAGTYAGDGSCAVSATGHGEYFIRGVIAYDIAAMVKYRGFSLEKAVHEAIDVKLTAAGGSGGVIALDTKGNIAMAFNTSGMYRGFIRNDGKPVVLM
jgi:beta-aspartyl-peptidase (threonine type)